jgi:hypothetical protein
MARIPRLVTFRRSDLRRAIRAAEDAGLAVTGTTISPDGSIRLEFTSPEMPSETKIDAETKSWERAIERMEAKAEAKRRKKAP